MNIYEKIAILNPSLNEEELKSVIDRITDLITNSGGEVLKVDIWGKKRFAYEIAKQKMGFYVLFLFKSPASTVMKIEDYFKVFDPVMKFMVIKLGKKQIAALPKEVVGIPVTPEEMASPVEPKVGS